MLQYSALLSKIKCALEFTSNAHSQYITETELMKLFTVYKVTVSTLRR